MEAALKIPALAAVPLLLAHEALYLTTYETVTLQIEDKNTVFAQEPAPSDGYTPVNWLVYTPDEVFRVSADWRRLEFRSAERYHSLKQGNSYKVMVAGWRIPELNWYRNIVRVEPT